MSIAKERIRSANINSKSNPRRRYQKIHTQSSQSFQQQSLQKMRSHSREWSKGKGVKLGKQKQQLAEENLNLKSFINNLQEQLSLKRSQLEMSKKKTVKYSKQFNREFEKEIYYSGKNPSSYLFSGIKQQYENIKNLYQQKCDEINALLQQPIHTELQELAILNEELLRENCKLRQKIQMNFQGLQQDEVYFEEIDRTKAKVALRDHEIEELKKKISFLQKLVIQKDNNQHQARRKAKALERSRKTFENEIAQLKRQLESTQQSNDRRIQALLQTSGKKLQMEALVFRNALRDKDLIINQLEKQVRYLSTLLSYWKPLDQIHHSKQHERQAFLDTPLIRFNTSEKVRLDSMDEQHQALSSNDNQRYSRDKSMRGSSKDEELSGIRKSVGGIHSQSQQLLPVQKIKTCATKHGQSSIKCRRVEPRQIKGISQLLRYRLIGQRVSMQRVKQLLDQHNAAEDSNTSQYISMREVKKILMDGPFGLSQQDATLFSRYVVQDQPGEYVYSDDENQIKRSIAKSIFRATIEEYNIPEEADILVEWEKMKSTYLPNIQSALKVIAPSGVISQAKFVELLVGLGIEMKDQLKDWMIASMVINSKSLKELNYRSLIPQ